jgi:hypothetical protein
MSTLSSKLFIQQYSARIRAGWLDVPVSGGAGNFSLHHRVQTGSGAHPTSYPRAISRGIKRLGREADHTLRLVLRSRKRGAISPLPNTSSWRGAQLKHRDNFTFTCSSCNILFLLGSSFSYRALLQGRQSVFTSQCNELLTVGNLLTFSWVSSVAPIEFFKSNFTLTTTAFSVLWNICP